MTKQLRIALAVIAVLISCSGALSQEISWNTAPQIGFVFQISNKEAQKLLTISSPDTIFSRLLHTQVDTFDVKKGWINRPSRGHFILARIIENKLHCEYTNVFPYKVFLLKEYDALALQVLDLDGNVREDAVVRLKRERIKIDPESKTYRIKTGFVGNERIVTVDLDGFRSVFNIEKHEAPTWYNDWNSSDGPSFYSYMLTDKNKYKPGEKVRFKSYALSHARLPLHKSLEVWLTGRNKSKKVGEVLPHRPGGYAGEVQLHDSLKLTLDQFYNLQLREKRGRIVSDCKFKYEDYELNGNSLEIHLAHDNQYGPASNELSITATDANSLFLKDGRASVLVRLRSIREAFQPVVMLRDTLFFHAIDLASDEATTVNIPSSLFGKANVTYEVNVSVENSQHQKIERTVSANYFYSKYEITARFSNDSIIYELQDNGAPMHNVPMEIRHDNQREPRKVFLPYKEKLNPAISIVRLDGELASREIPMRSLVPRLELIGGIERDSFRITLSNPQKLALSWHIYQGSEMLHKGFGEKLEYAALITNRMETFYVELLYSFAGEEHTKRRDYVFRDGYLNVSLDLPDRAYPGQAVDATINVTDQLGLPVRGADLTALAVNGKLNYDLRDLPDYGTGSTPRPMGTTYDKRVVDKRTAILKLDYNRWKKRAGLDTMKYYQFIYPRANLFGHTTFTGESAQFAPYVMQGGTAKRVYVIEVNRMPVYYSWVDQPRQYSFYVPFEGKSEITLRLFDRVLVFDSISFAKCTKSILSVDLDDLPESVKIIKIGQHGSRGRKRRSPDSSFTLTEINRHQNYLSSFKRVDGPAYLESGSQFTPLFAWQSKFTNSQITVGPITPGRQTFVGNGGARTSYRHTGGYLYAFEDNVVYKLNTSGLLPDRLRDFSYSPAATLNDLVMTKKAFIEAANAPENKWHPRAIELIDRAMQMTMLLPQEQDSSGVRTVLFENCATKKMVSPCQGGLGEKVDFFSLPRGLHNAIVIYNNGKYLKMDSIDLWPFTKIVVDFNQVELHLPDSLFSTWPAVATSNCFETPVRRVIPMRYSSRTHGNIRGTVYDQNETLPGANVIIKGTVDGTVTDSDGNFALYADQSAVTLVVSFIGYTTKEVEVEVGSEVSIFLEQDVQQLSEVVVVGYGHERTSRNLAYALSGRIGGVQISQPDRVEAILPEMELQEAETRMYHELLTLNTIRSRFSDVALWEPKLFTDKNGQSKFKINYPEDITRWDATVYAMNRRLQTGTARKRVRSYKPIAAELHAPNFLTRGDSANFLGKVLNYTDDKNIRGIVKWDGAQTDFEKAIQLNEFHVNELPVFATTTDSVTGRYLFTRDDGYLDGEERKIPVVEQGAMRAEGTLSILKNNESVSIKASPGENVKIGILANQVDVYAGEARYLLDYRYACNEQLASKLMGLINYRMLMQFEGNRFKYDRDVERIIARLLRNQNQEFLWSWWDVSTNTSYWMSAHILRALRTAFEAGYKVDLDIANIARKAEYKFEMLKLYNLDDADLLHALASWNAALKYAKHVRKLDSLLVRIQDDATRKGFRYRSHSLLKEKLQLLEVRQLMHLPYQRDTLLRYQKNGIRGEVHFSDGKIARNWYTDELTTNAIAYRMVRRDTVLNYLLGPMQLYFLGERSKGGWNTYNSANILTSVLPDLLAAGATKENQAFLSASGYVNATINKFPYQLDLRPGEEVTIRKESGLPVYFMQYKEERVTEAHTGVEGFEIRTRLGNDGPVLQAGKPVTLTVEVRITREASQEYVMIEVPIPASCSYQDKIQNENIVETHREYFKDRTVIFCENMKSGSYTFTVNLLPRFTGKYLINPAQVSLMYVPVVNANTDMKVVKVK